MYVYAYIYLRPLQFWLKKVAQATSSLLKTAMKPVAPKGPPPGMAPGEAPGPATASPSATPDFAAFVRPFEYFPNPRTEPGPQLDPNAQPLQAQLADYEALGTKLQTLASHVYPQPFWRFYAGQGNEGLFSGVLLDEERLSSRPDETAQLRECCVSWG